RYEKVCTENLQEGDVLVWIDVTDIIQHAAYHIGQNLFFNKHGQTIFDPWKLLKKEHLYNKWGSNYFIHSRMVKNNSHPHSFLI
ncbi:MAG: hypothetical protein RR642_16530, partial [Solibacillus sp.]